MAEIERRPEWVECCELEVGEVDRVAVEKLGSHLRSCSVILLFIFFAICYYPSCRFFFLTALLR